MDQCANGTHLCAFTDPKGTTSKDLQAVIHEMLRCIKTTVGLEHYQLQHLAYERDTHRIFFIHKGKRRFLPLRENQVSLLLQEYGQMFHKYEQSKLRVVKSERCNKEEDQTAGPRDTVNTVRDNVSMRSSGMITTNTSFDTQSDNSVLIESVSESSVTEPQANREQDLSSFD